MAAEDRAHALEASELSSEMRGAMLEALFASGSNLLVLPVQDVFGWRDRINQPATVGEPNWTWKLPWPSDGLTTEPEAVAMANQLRDWSRRHGRSGKVEEVEEVEKWKSGKVEK